MRENGQIKISFQDISVTDLSSILSLDDGRVIVD
jgi:hypothetical protein